MLGRWKRWAGWETVLAVGVVALLVLAAPTPPAPAADRPEEQPEIAGVPFNRYVAMPVRVTDQMLKSEADAVATYTVKTEATVQVSVCNLERERLRQAEPRRATPKEPNVEVLGKWPDITRGQAGTYVLVYAVTNKGASRTTFASVGHQTTTKVDSRRIDPPVEATPPAGQAFTIKYKLQLTSKVMCRALDPRHWSDPPKPVWSSNEGERKGGASYECKWEPAKQNPPPKAGSYLIQVFATPLTATDPEDGDTDAALVQIR